MEVSCSESSIGSVVAYVSIEGDALDIKLEWIDKLLAFQGSLRMPLSHVTNAYVSPVEDLGLEEKLKGVGPGFLATVGIFSSAKGLVFCDLDNFNECLVIETRGERFPLIAVSPENGDPNQLAHAIMRAVPDSGPEE